MAVHSGINQLSFVQVQQVTSETMGLISDALIFNSQYLRLQQLKNSQATFQNYEKALAVLEKSFQKWLYIQLKFNTIQSPLVTSITFRFNELETFFVDYKSPDKQRDETLIQFNETWHDFIHNLVRFLEVIASYKHDFDSLTQLFNRRRLFEILEKTNFFQSLSNEKIFVCMCDIDNFKKINDLYGHPEGDRVIKKIASIMKASIRDSDIIARVGGEEFVLVIFCHQQQIALDILERIRKEIEDTQFAIDSREFFVTASFGLAQLEEESNVSAALRMADKQMFNAKKLGKNRVVY